MSRRDFIGILKLSFSVKTVKSTWESWGSWSQCSNSCGGGVRTRSRACADRSHSWSKVKDCKKGSPIDAGSCGTDPCPGETSKGFSSNLSQPNQHGRVGAGGVHAHSLVVGGLVPERESARLGPRSNLARACRSTQTPVETIHVQVRF